MHGSPEAHFSRCGSVGLQVGKLSPFKRCLYGQILDTRFFEHSRWLGARLVQFNILWLPPAAFLWRTTWFLSGFLSGVLVRGSHWEQWRRISLNCSTACVEHSVHICGNSFASHLQSHHLQKSMSVSCPCSSVILNVPSIATGPQHVLHFTHLHHTGNVFFEWMEGPHLVCGGNDLLQRRPAKQDTALGHIMEIFGPGGS